MRVFVQNRFAGFALVAMFLLMPFGVAGASEIEWGYHGEIGPEIWGSLDASFASCDTGTSQSPIDIPADDDCDGVEALTLSLSSATSLEVENNGHTIEVEVPVFDGMLTLDGKDFVLVQFHFHTDSEHLIDGESFPMEMHLVHRSADGTLAVVGAMIEAGEAHEELAKIFDDLPQAEGDHRSVEDFDLGSLVPDDLEVFRYSGSLTTPGCSEGVRWNVLAEPIELSFEQIDAFRAIFSGSEFPQGNRRPVQPLNGRDIETGCDYDYDDDEDDD